METDRAAGPDARPVVAATLPPIAALVEWVGGEVVRVTTLLPPGAHPDTYEATPRI
ncbi:MAG: zinc ABC transporter solute-binding protein, partial [Gammaproteobacteria bacterium]|nr:zinc ABC transporter substrate-binding protein [Gemmatimonadota bacterium]NIR40541.1 zinc ABC transporter substrate-binding protein [Actinomycetota bacterium]NIS35442.1 zinc ABC transporter substrate-binding protein [Actinomycetota bacterium]NIU77253.1 zinc ABC transporter solute-binding protein [Gammaproteobacteria bacterium]NIX24256.1 zinc ABC transporter solute-binding protein [Actinomycetota bacterium]